MSDESKLYLSMRNKYGAAVASGLLVVACATTPGVALAEETPDVDTQPAAEVASAVVSEDTEGSDELTGAIDEAQLPLEEDALEAETASVVNEAPVLPQNGIVPQAGETDISQHPEWLSLNGRRSTDLLPALTYTGYPLRLTTSEVRILSTLLTPNDDYELKYDANTNLGTATVSVVGRGAYTGTVDFHFNIVPQEITVTGNNLTYNGNEQTGVSPSTSYTIVSGDTKATQPGTYTARVKPNYGYSWVGGGDEERDVKWSIAPSVDPSKISIEQAIIEFLGVYPYPYTGEDIMPELRVTLPRVSGDSRVLVKDRDFTAEFFDNRYVSSQARVVITGIGNYTGTASANFTIIGKTIQVPAGLTLGYIGAEQVGVPSGEGYTISGDYKATEIGTYTAQVTPDANHCWSDGTRDTRDVQWSIVESTRTAISLPSARTGLIYNGSAQTGVAAGEGYTVTGNTATNAGSYTARVTPDATHCWDDGTVSERTVTWSIAKAPVSVPTAATGLVANGRPQTGVAASSLYNVFGGASTEAGSYTAIVSLTDPENHYWAGTDNDSTIRYIVWSIADASSNPDPGSGSGSQGTQDAGSGAASAAAGSSAAASARKGTLSDSERLAQTGEAQNLALPVAAAGLALVAAAYLARKLLLS